MIDVWIRPARGGRWCAPIKLESGQKRCQDCGGTGEVHGGYRGYGAALSGYWKECLTCCERGWVKAEQ